MTPSASQDPASRVEKFWDESAENKAEIIATFWTAHPLVQERLSRKIAGDPAVNMYVFAKSYLEQQGVRFPVARAGSLGCGTGDLERGLAQIGVARELWGYDVSPGSIAIAAQQAQSIEAAQLNYQVMDLNAPTLGEGRFDIIFATSSVHHVEALELLADSIARALVPGGWLVMHEYIGPTRFQWTDRQQELMNAVLDSLPVELRTTVAGRVKSGLLRPTIEEMIEVDPSESVRSADIMSVFGERFDIVLQRDYGGTLLQFLLAEIVHNFKGVMGEAVLKQIFLIEDLAIESGELRSDFTFAVLRPKV